MHATAVFNSIQLLLLPSMWPHFSGNRQMYSETTGKHRLMSTACFPIQLLPEIYKKLVT